MPEFLLGSLLDILYHIIIDMSIKCVHIKTHLFKMKITVLDITVYFLMERHSK